MSTGRPSGSGAPRRRLPVPVLAALAGILPAAAVYLWGAAYGLATGKPSEDLLALPWAFAQWGAPFGLVYGLIRWRSNRGAVSTTRSPQRGLGWLRWLGHAGVAVVFGALGLVLGVTVELVRGNPPLTSCVLGAVHGGGAVILALAMGAVEEVVSPWPGLS